MLLSQLMRSAAITGSTDVVPKQLLGRQGGRWAQQWLDSSVPGGRASAAPAADHGARLRTLDDLHRRGLLTDEELERARAKLA